MTSKSRIGPPITFRYIEVSGGGVDAREADGDSAGEGGGERPPTNFFSRLNMKCPDSR